MTIQKKILPQYFEEVKSGKKKFELRLNDFDINENDTILLKEWDPNIKNYTGRIIEKKVTNVLKFHPKKQSFWTEEEINKNGIQIISF